MKKHQFGLSLCLILLLVVSACDTQSISNIRLFVGQADGVTAEKMMIVDGQGQKARFGAIRQLEADSVGNLYVYDLGAEYETVDSDNIYRFASIRRITPEGKVDTLIGRNVNRELYGRGFPGFAIRANTIYFASMGCLMKADLRTENFEVVIIYGKCLSIEDAQRQIEQTPPTSKNHDLSAEPFLVSRFEPIMPRNEIYLRPSSRSNKVLNYLKISSDDEVEVSSRIEFIKSGLFSSRYRMDSKGRVYGFQEGDPGPGIPGDNRLVRIKDIDSPGISEVFYEEKLSSPRVGFLALDNQDDLYVLDQDIFKRIAQQGRVQNLAQLKNLGGEGNSKKAPIWDQVVDPQRTYLYFATDTAIYKILLPPTTP